MAVYDGIGGLSASGSTVTQEDLDAIARERGLPTGSVDPTVIDLTLVPIASWKRNWMPAVDTSIPSPTAQNWASQLDKGSWVTPELAAKIAADKARTQARPTAAASPQGNDSGPPYVLLAAVGAVAIVGAAIFLKKRKRR